MLHEHHKEIDGVTYKATTYPGRPGVAIMARLLLVLPDEESKTFLRLLVHDKDGGLNFEEALTVLSQPAVALQMMLGAGKEFGRGGDYELVRDIMRYVETEQLQLGEAQGKGNVYDHFDRHFQGRFAHMGKVALWALRVGFGVP